MKWGKGSALVHEEAPSNSSSVEARLEEERDLPPTTRYTCTWSKVIMVISDPISDLFVVRVDKVSTSVPESPLVKAGQIFHPAVGVVHCHLGGRELPPCQYHLLL